MSAQLGESLTGANLSACIRHWEPRYLLDDETDRLTGPHEDRELSPASSIRDTKGRKAWRAGRALSRRALCQLVKECAVKGAGLDRVQAPPRNRCAPPEIKVPEGYWWIRLDKRRPIKYPHRHWLKCEFTGKYARTGQLCTPNPSFSARKQVANALIAGSI